ncbi:hypothetical protein QNE90_003419 [Vibrio alginolyticus]|nr:hypothetical protein [Vibrio alginolyticus]
MTEQHCGTRLVKGLSFKFDEENKRVYLSPSFYFDHLRNVRELMRRKLDERMPGAPDSVLKSFGKLFNSVLADERLMTFSQKCSEVLNKRCESREDARQQMENIASELSNQCNKQVAKVLRAENDILKSKNASLEGQPSPIELIAMVLESMRSKARKVHNPEVSTIH